MNSIVKLLGVIFICSSMSPLLNAQESNFKKDHSAPSNLIYHPELIASGASFGYLFGDTINILTHFHFDFPFIVKQEKSAYMHLRLSNSLSREEGFSFKVFDTDYQMTLGARDYFTRKIIISAFISQQGTERADAEGSPYIRFVGFSMESSDYRDHKAERGLFWYSEMGAIFKKKEIEAELTFKGNLRWNYLVTNGRSYGIDFQIDSLIDNFDTSNDWLLGPRISFCPPCSLSPSIFLYYVNSNNPLGIGDDGFLLGFQYSERKGRMKEFKKILPEMNGSISTGAGEGREEFHFALKLRSPDFPTPKNFRAILEVDQYMLTASDTGELYYLLTGGIESLWKDLIYGAYIYHRSNHQLAETNDRIMSRNIFEAGISTIGWNRKNLSDGYRIHVGLLSRPALFNFFLKGGYLINSTFGESRRWNIRTGARFDFPFKGKRFSPFLSASWEGGEVSRKEVQVGIRTALDMDLALIYKKDEQYFGRDQDLFLLEAALFY